MASTYILSDNGVSSGSNGIKATGGNDGVLILQTTTAGGTATNALYIDANQNVGIGATPTNTSLTINQTRNLSWQWAGNTYNYANIFNQTSSASLIIGSGYQQSNTANGFASSVPVGWDKSAISVGSGGIKFYADAVTTVAVGTDITPTQRMLIDYNGNVGIGTNSPNLNTTGTVLHINNSTASRASAIHMTNAESGSSASDGFLVGKWSNGINYVYDYDNNPIVFGTNNAERLTLTTAGNLQFSTTSGGIIFNKSGALNNSTLNDYEEGSWTPVSGSANITVGAVYSARYVKVGNLVHVSCYINVTNSTGSSGITWNCAGLPFAMYTGTYGSAFRYYGPSPFNNNCYVESGATYIIDQNGLATGAGGYMLSATYMTN
jgi:hypothetical protein